MGIGQGRDSILRRATRDNRVVGKEVEIEKGTFFRNTTPGRRRQFIHRQ